jgi:hypothetical protein
MMDPTIAGRIVADIWSIALVLGQIHAIEDPIDDSYDRDELIDALREFRENWLAGLGQALERLEGELLGAAAILSYDYYKTAAIPPRLQMDYSYFQSCRLQ